MSLLPRLALRNLGRQRRRSFMLGSAIALGTAVLVTANAFAHGISVTMFERVIVWVAGHAGVVVSEVGNADRQLFRDAPFLRAQMEGLPQVKRAEETVGVFARALGKGRSDNAILVGIDLRQKIDEKERRELEQNFRMTKGRWESLGADGIDLPLVLAQEKARELGVDSGDEIRLRFTDAHGAFQAAKGKVAGIFRSDNMFMQAPIFVDLVRLRSLLGFQPWESSGFRLVLHDPQRDAVPVAESLHVRLRPGVARIPATAPDGRGFSVWGLDGDSATRAAWKARWNVPESLARRSDLALVGAGSGLAEGDTLALAWPARYGTDSGRAVLRRVFPVRGLPDSAVLWRQESFFRSYYGALPPRLGAAPPCDTAWVVREWNLLPRPRTTDEYRKLMAQAALDRGKGAIVSVHTMYEAASDILKLEDVLNLITGWGVFVLFLIILIGVLNTLRMTVRERTREIGTLRAVGIQARQILSLFLLETLFLSLLSCAAGVVLGFAAMAGLASIPIDLHDNPMGMLLVDGRLYFAPTVGGIAFAVVLISLMATATAWFPARSAARLPPADALRHHE